MKRHRIRDNVLGWEIEIFTEGNSGSINFSSIRKLLTKKETEVIEKTMLAHACAGIEIASPEYIEGINAVMEGLGNDL